MSKPVGKVGGFVKKHPWEAAGAAAALGLGGAGLAGYGPLSGLLGPAIAEGAAPAIPEAGAALFGASGLADLAGATGDALASTPSVSSPFLSGAQMGNIGKGLKYANMATKVGGLLNQQNMPMPPAGQPPISGVQPVNTVLPGLTPPAPAGVDPAEWAAFWKQKQQRQFGGLA